MKKILVFSWIIAMMLIGMLGLTAAAGCCYNPEDGLCSKNADENACVSAGGNWTEDTSCESESRCDYGCCALGLSVEYSTQRQCEVFSNNYGLVLNFQSGVTEDVCYSISLGNESGACITGEYESKTCTFTAENSCSGTFSANTLCSAVYENCTQVSSTVCYDGDVYYKDSCGNPDAKKSDCDYASGTVCKGESEAAYCKDLNCGEHKNGDRWCVGIESVSEETEEEPAPTLKTEQAKLNVPNIQDILKGKFGFTGFAVWLKAKITGKSIGITGYALYCGNDYSNEEGVEPWFCEGSNIRSTDPDDCDRRCKEFRGISENTLSSQGASPSTEETEEESEGFGEGSDNAPVGSRFFSQYCLNGEIYTEPCADFRADYCSDEETGGECELNEWQSCTGLSEEECGESGQCYWLSPEILCEEKTIGSIASKSMTSGIRQITECENELVKQLNLGTCAPNIPGGFEFYPKETGTSSSTSSEEELGAPKSAKSGTNIISEIKNKTKINIPGVTGFAASDDSEDAGESEEAGGSEICGKGNYASEIQFSSPGGSSGLWIFQLDKEADGEYWGNLGLLDTVLSEWKVHDEDDGEITILGSNKYLGSAYERTGYVYDIKNKKRKTIPLNSQVIEFLNQRCRALGDCDGKVNWQGAEGGESNLGSFTCNETETGAACEIKYSKRDFYDESKDKTIMKFNFNFSCSPWTAPEGDESCSKCGGDNLACSEYRCKSLGKGCEYSEPDGAEKTYCVSSSDHSPPEISHSLNPASPVPPYSAVSITLTTNEDAKCRFDIGNSGNKYDKMVYDFSGRYTREHTTTLYVPGLSAYNESEGYEIITKDGKYEVFVRCEDATGNPNIEAYLVDFEVMETPDELAPILSDFNPASGSKIAYGQTSKSISFKIKEPAECKWDFSDKNFAEMENSFSCDTSASDYGVLNGYYCSGTLTNVTNDIESETKFYIRCKDQPELEGKEDQYYQRNEHQSGIEYILKPSPMLQITSISPSGEIKITESNRTVIIKATTAYGADEGNAECWWSIDNLAWSKFISTGSKTHSQTITSASEGNYTLYAACNDSANNIAINSTSVNLTIDRTAPQIIFTYNLGGSLNIVTEEEAKCRYNTNSTIGCNWEYSNGTIMSTSDNLAHTTSYTSESAYYIKCEDYFGNMNGNTACAFALFT